MLQTKFSSEDIKKEFIDVANMKILVMSAVGIGKFICSKQEHLKSQSSS